MMKTINERIMLLITELGLTPNSFADKLGCKGTVIYNIQKDRNKPSYGLIVNIIQLFNVSSDWLLLGIGERHKGECQLPADEATYKGKLPESKYELINAIACFEYMTLDLRQRILKAHNLDENAVNVIIDNYASEKIDGCHIGITLTCNENEVYQISRI